MRRCSDWQVRRREMVDGAGRWSARTRSMSVGRLRRREVETESLEVVEVLRSSSKRLSRLES